MFWFENIYNLHMLIFFFQKKPKTSYIIKLNISLFSVLIYWIYKLYLKFNIS
jgi:hypothetical protein